MEKLSKLLGIEHVFINEVNWSESVNSQDSYAPYGGCGSGNKNGHFGCKHTIETKKKMSELKKNKPTWNKGIKGYLVHTEESKRAMSEKLSGSQNGRSLLSEIDVRNIIDCFLKKPKIDGVGKIMPNGKKMSYLWAFCNLQAPKYNISPVTIKRLLTKKTWKNVWSEYKI